MCNPDPKGENVSNFLDLNCPMCGGQDRLQIVGTTWLDVTDDGTDATNSDHEYHPHSYTRCGACGFAGILSDLETDQLPLPLTVEGGRQ